jgi:hypothetical protein
VEGNGKYGRKCGEINKEGKKKRRKKQKAKTELTINSSRPTYNLCENTHNVTCAMFSGKVIQYYQ